MILARLGKLGKLGNHAVDFPEHYDLESGSQPRLQGCEIYRHRPVS